MIKIDARGDACPLPVVKAKKAIAELRGPGELLGQRQSGVMSLGAGAALSDTALLKETHDAARELLRSPNSEEARAVIARAEALFAERLHDVAMN